MNEFNKAAQLMVVSPNIAAETRTQEEKEGPDPLAAAVQYMGGDGIAQSDARIEVFSDLFLNSPQLVAERLPDVRHAVDAQGNRTVWHAADGRAEQETMSRESRSCQLTSCP